MEIALQSPIKTRKQSKDKNKAVVTDCKFVLKKQNHVLVMKSAAADNFHTQSLRGLPKYSCAVTLVQCFGAVQRVKAHMHKCSIQALESVLRPFGFKVEPNKQRPKV